MIQIENFDLTTKPSDDFDTFVNGSWKKNNKIPSKYSKWGTFEVLHEENIKKVKDIIELVSSNQLKLNNNIDKKHCQLIENLYKTGMNTTKINKEGIQKIQNLISEIELINNKEKLIYQIAKMHQIGNSVFFSIYTGPDSKNTEINRLHLHHSGLGLGEKDYYLSKEKQFITIKNKYQSFIESTFKLIYPNKNQNEIKIMSQKVINLETKIASNSLSNVERRDTNKRYNPYTISKLQDLSPAINWKQYLSCLNITSCQKCIVDHPDFYQNLDKILQDNDSVKLYLIFHLVSDLSSFLSKDYVENQFNFYGKILRGQKKMKPRWQRICSNVSNLLDDAVGNFYVKKYFDPESKKKVQKMVKSMIKTLENIIKNLSWMEEKTKKKALLKLNTMNFKIGYPNKWSNYKNLELYKDSYVLNYLRCAKYDFNKEIVDTVDQKVDKDKWLMPAQQINAYYYPQMNEIVFPAAILQSPFFDKNAEDAYNYGGIGAVIGHEITHAFDDQGCQYDEKGQLKNWWTKKDKKMFDQNAANIIKQYSNFQLHNTNVRGELTQGENIADVGGVKISLQSLIHSNNIKLNKLKKPDFSSLSSVDDFNPIQKFFISWANIWRCKITKEEALRRIQMDPHSPNCYRINGTLQNVELFNQQFNVNKGDEMYLEEEKRLTVW